MAMRAYLGREPEAAGVEEQGFGWANPNKTGVRPVLRNQWY
jgi:catalase (peroxidase I)